MELKTISKKELKKILESDAIWLQSYGEKGSRANSEEELLFVVEAENEEDAARQIREHKYLEGCDIESIVEIPEELFKKN